MPGTLWRDLGSRAQILLYLSSPLFSASLFADKVSLPALKKRKRSQKLLFLKSNVLVLELHHIKEKEKETNQNKNLYSVRMQYKVFFSCRQNTKELLKEMSYVREGLSLCTRRMGTLSFFSVFLVFVLLHCSKKLAAGVEYSWFLILFLKSDWSLYVSYCAWCCKSNTALVLRVIYWLCNDSTNESTGNMCL